jgi:hypothetical protein
MKFTYPDRVNVKFGGHQAEGTVMSSHINRRWDRKLRQHVPYEIVHLVSFGEGCGCWYPEDQLEDVVD